MSIRKRLLSLALINLTFGVLGMDTSGKPSFGLILVHGTDEDFQRALDTRNPNEQDSLLGTPLQFVARCVINSDDVRRRIYRRTKSLLEGGADPNMVPHMLGTVADPEIAKLLIAHGARVNLADTNGRTPLHNTVDFNLCHTPNIAVVRVFCENGAHIDALDAKGRTALHYVQNADIAAFLVRKGADPSIRDKNGTTALEGCDWILPEQAHLKEKRERAIIESLNR